VGSGDERGWVTGRGRRTFGKMHVSGTVLLVRSKKEFFFFANAVKKNSSVAIEGSLKCRADLILHGSRCNHGGKTIPPLEPIRVCCTPPLDPCHICSERLTASSDSLGNLLAPPVPQRCPPLESSVVCTKNHWTTARRKKNLAQTNNYGVGPCHLSRSPSIVRPGYRTGHASCRRNCAVRGVDVIRAILR
jgi:hypothetical protein